MSLPAFENIRGEIRPGLGKWRWRDVVVNALVVINEVTVCFIVVLFSFVGHASVSFGTCESRLLFK